MVRFFLSIKSQNAKKNALREIVGFNCIVEVRYDYEYFLFNLICTVRLRVGMWKAI